MKIITGNVSCENTVMRIYDNDVEIMSNCLTNEESEKTISRKVYKNIEFKENEDSAITHSTFYVANN